MEMIVKVFFIFLVIIAGICELSCFGASVDLKLREHKFNLPFGTKIFDPEKHSLPVNSALLLINSTLDTEDVSIFMQTKECYKCPVLPVRNISAGGSVILAVDTNFPTRLVVCHKRSSTCIYESLNAVCSIDKHFGERGSYNLFISPNSTPFNVMCNMIMIKEPVDEYMPIIVALSALTVLSLLSVIGTFFYRRKYQRSFGGSSLVDKDLGPPSEEPVNTSDYENLTEKDKSIFQSRLRSLDTFRGFSLAIMVFVNYGGGKYAIFHHSRWNGLSVADLVFPWFVFIIGVSVAMAFNKALSRGRSRRQLGLKLIKRTFLLFTIGLILNSKGPVDISNLRIPGVLQRLAVSYLVVAMLEILTGGRVPLSIRGESIVRDITSNVTSWIVLALLVATWLLVTFYLPVPYCPKGYLGPGGLHDYQSHPEWINCTGGAAGYIDRWFFGETHIYQRDTSKKIYQGPMAYDPEGMLGSLTSIVLAFLGVQAGRIFLTFDGAKSRIIRLFVWCILTGAIGIGLCGASKNDGWIPINKNLWSLSFVLVMGSAAYLLLALFYWIIDVKRAWSGTPFYEPGMNSILVYVGHEIFRGYFPFSWKAGESHSEHLAMNMLGTAYWIIIAVYLDFIKFYVTL